MYINRISGYRYNLTSACNSACACARDYNPVCGSDGVVYYSACHAGCTSVNGTGLNQVRTDSDLPSSHRRTHSRVLMSEGYMGIPSNIPFFSEKYL